MLFHPNVYPFHPCLFPTKEYYCIHYYLHRFNDFAPHLYLSSHYHSSGFFSRLLIHQGCSLACIPADICFLVFVCSASTRTNKIKVFVTLMIHMIVHHFIHICLLLCSPCSVPIPIQFSDFLHPVFQISLLYHTILFSYFHPVFCFRTFTSFSVHSINVC